PLRGRLAVIGVRRAEAAPQPAPAAHAQRRRWGWGRRWRRPGIDGVHRPGEAEGPTRARQPQASGASQAGDAPQPMMLTGPTPLREDLSNREGHREYDIHWHDPEPTPNAFTSVIRVKNESQSLPWVLPGLFRISE